jgi:transposase
MKTDKLGRAVGNCYSEEFKRKVIEEYLRTGTPKLILQRKYDIKFKSGICTWMKKLGYADIHEGKPYFEVQGEHFLKERFTMPKKKEEETQGQPGSMAGLEKRVKELERELEDEKLRSEAYKLTIEIAEKEFNIPIRKK